MAGTSAARTLSSGAYIDKLLAENQALKDEIEVLKQSLKADVLFPWEWRLTRSQALILHVMAARKIITETTAFATLYSDRPDPPTRKVLDVLVHHMRKKLRPFGIGITTVWGRGYALDDVSRARVLALSKSTPFTPSAGTAGFSEEAR